MIRALFLPLALTLVGCAGSSGGSGWRFHRGPDAALSQAAPSGRLEWSVQRPVFDRDGNGATADRRTAVILVDVEASRWLVSARFDASGGLLFAAALHDAVEAAPDGCSCGMEIDVRSRSDATGQASRPVPGGYWTCDGVGSDGCVVVTLRDEQNDPLASVRMDAAEAAHLYRALDRVLRTAPVHTVLGKHTGLLQGVDKPCSDV